jgi:hypothetical protein
LICGFVPDEGFGVTVVVLDEAADSVFQFFGGAMDAAAKFYSFFIRVSCAAETTRPPP